MMLNNREITGSIRRTAILIVLGIVVIALLFGSCAAPSTTTPAPTAPAQTPAPAVTKIVWKAQSYSPIQTAPYGPFSTSRQVNGAQ